MPRVVDAAAWHRYARFRVQGLSLSEAARRSAISVAAAQSFDAGSPRSSGRLVRVEYAHLPPFSRIEALSEAIQAQAPPVELARLAVASRQQAPLAPLMTDVGRAALGDFELFRRRFFGHVSTPWQIDAWERLREHIAAPERRFVVINVAPGLGKTTLLHDICARLIAEDRRVRGCFISAKESLAARMTNRLRRSLERQQVVLAREEERYLGLALDAEATLVDDFGPFKPEARDLMWRASEFYVVQSDGSLPTEKEPTWSSYGFDSQIIGTRLSVMVADDVESARSLRNPEVIEDRRRVWRDELETRLEPSGTLFMVMQRLDPEDMSSYCLSMETLLEAEADVVSVSGEEPSRQKYVHIKYAAHDEERCSGDHRRAAPAWPQGCLLDPLRLPSWGELDRLRRSEPATFNLVYQQTDEGVLSTTLVDPSWVDGGKDKQGLLSPGCWDVERGVWESPWPHGDRPATLQVVTVDPSGSNFWAVQSWVYADPSGARDPELKGDRILLATERVRMGGNQLLDWNSDRREFYGLLEESRLAFERIGLPLNVVVVEVNAAQRYLLQFEHAKRWSRQHSVLMQPHTTGAHKLDADLGVPALAVQWRLGRVRLPGRSQWDRQAVEPLVRQALRWRPGSPGETDQVMAQWFLEAALPTLLSLMPSSVQSSRQWRPSWVRRPASGQNLPGYERLFSRKPQEVVF